MTVDEARKALVEYIYDHGGCGCCSDRPEDEDVAVLIDALLEAARAG